MAVKRVNDKGVAAAEHPCRIRARYNQMRMPGWQTIMAALELLRIIARPRALLLGAYRAAEQVLTPSRL